MTAEIPPADLARSIHHLLGAVHMELAGTRRMTHEEATLVDDLGEWYGRWKDRQTKIELRADDRPLREERIVDSERIVPEEETRHKFREVWMREPDDKVRVTSAEVGPGEGEVERIDDEREDVEEWQSPSDGGPSDTTSSWWERLLRWTRRTTPPAS